MVKILKFLLLALALLASYRFFKSKRSELVTDAVNSYILERDAAQESLKFFTDAPHPMGSSRQKEVQEYLLSRLESLKLNPIMQSFTVETPNKSLNALAPLTLPKDGTNISARLNLVENPSCVVGLASHYDTKDVDGIAYLGANDSGSSSVLLLDLTKYLLRIKNKLSLQCDVQVIWFDGEEPILANWNDGLTKHPARIIDNTYGSRHFAQLLKPCEDLPFVGLILLDMIGYEDLQLTLDANSHPHLKSLLISASEFLEKKELINIHKSQPVADDHLPFKERGLAVLNIIDFNHLALWHTSADQIETVSMNSMEIAGKLGLYVLLSSTMNPDPLKESSLGLCMKP